MRSRKVVFDYVVIDGKGKKLKDTKRTFKTVLRRAGIHNSFRASLIHCHEIFY